MKLNWESGVEEKVGTASTPFGSIFIRYHKTMEEYQVVVPPSWRIDNIDAYFSPTISGAKEVAISVLTKMLEDSSMNWDTPGVYAVWKSVSYTPFGQVNILLKRNGFMVVTPNYWNNFDVEDYYADTEAKAKQKAEAIFKKLLEKLNERR